MPKLRVLSGTDIVSVLKKFGFELVSQSGSHAKLKRVSGGEKQILTVPLHRELDKGTVKAIFRQASRYISEDELKGAFYTA